MSCYRWLLTIVIFVLSINIGIGQTFPNNTTQASDANLTFIKGGTRTYPVLRWFPDTATANLEPYLKFTPHLIIKAGNVMFIRNTPATAWDAYIGGVGGFVPGGPIVHIPVLGDNPGVNVSPVDWIVAAFYVTPPTATLTGGVDLELTSVTPTMPFTLNWTAGRLSATTPLTSIIVAGTTQTFTQPAKPGTVSGTQLVNVPTNVSTTYSNVVTATDGKTATATTTFNFFPKRYWFYSTNQVPNNADVLADLGGAAEFTTTRVKSTQFVVTVSGTDKYVSYAYPTSMGALTSIIISGLESIGAFNRTTLSLTNASGYVQNYYVYTTDNIFQNTTITFISVQ